jgi:MFS family permease
VGGLHQRRGRAIVVALATTVTVSYGVLMYAFAVLLAPMQAELRLSRAGVSLAASISLAASAVAGVAVGWLMDRRDPRLVMTAGSMLAVLSVLAWSQRRTAALTILTVAGFAALAAGLTGLSQVAGRLLGGPIEGRFGPRRALALALALAGGAVALLALDRSTPAVLAFALLFGAGGGMQTLLSGTLPAALFGPASYGAVVGVLHACINGSRALGPLGAGIGVVLAGYVEFARVLAATLMATAVLTARPARGRRARAARPPARPAP